MTYADMRKLYTRMDVYYARTYTHITSTRSIFPAFLTNLQTLPLHCLEGLHIYILRDEDFHGS
jgi:hypothetical protein